MALEAPAFFVLSRLSENATVSLPYSSVSMTKINIKHLNLIVTQNKQIKITGLPPSKRFI